MQIGLQDYATKPLQGIQKTVTQTADIGRESWESIAGGAAGLVASGFAIQQALMPAIEMDRVLGEVKALGVMDDDLQSLQKTALDFSTKYGQSATEFVNHSGLMLDALGEMSGDVLADVTQNSATLAVAMKSDADTVSNYMKTVYGNYKSDAEAMGKGQFTAVVAGMTAEAKNLYGIGMSEIEGMVDGMHSLTSSLGVDFSEQLAVFGVLRGQMSEGDAVTQYTNYLEGVAGAQEKLGISFTNTEGKLLPMVDVLGKIEALTSGMSGLEARAFLDDAGLGDGSLMLMSLIKEKAQFQQGLTRFNAVQGVAPASDMAGTMTDQWERLEASWFAVRAGAFGLILPAINGVVGAMADGLATVTHWTEAFPTLTSYLGYASLVIIGGAAVYGAYSLAMGTSKLAMQALKVPLLLTKTSVLKVSGAYTKAKWSLWAFNYSLLKQGVYVKGASLANKAYAVSTFLVDKALMAASGGLKAFGLTALKSTAMMLANPLFWIPAAIVAVGVAAYALITHWDALVSALSDWYVFQQLGVLVNELSHYFEVGFAYIGTVWDDVTDSIASNPVFQMVVSELDWFMSRASGVFQGMVLVGKGAWKLLGAAVQWFITPFLAAWDVGRGFMAFLKDGPEAAMQIWGNIPARFGAIWQQVGDGFGLVYDGICLFVDAGLDVLQMLGSPFLWLQDLGLSLFDGLVQGWAQFSEYLASMSPFDVVGDGIDFLIDKINLLPGIHIGSDVDSPVLPSHQAIEDERRRTERNRPISNYLNGGKGTSPNVFGYLGQMAGNTHTDNSKTQHVGDVYITQQQPFTRSELSEWMELDTP
ncbi:phage tail tape measure protein [Vibrio sp. Of7-15]|uniref:phage tail tape measure protein n=1 Tax=Vibrio sp. Of7-15 TaxID=2724879 RepID=UPI0023B787D1|nr:phage tail tape measure protein [Vibrio sp. Of7-15]